MYGELRTRLNEVAKSLKDPSEGTTIANLILPALHSMGWNNPPNAMIEMHEQSVGGKQPDITLSLNTKRKAAIEAKSLGSDLDVKKSMSQAVGYAAEIKVRWVILTDGYRWDLFDCKYLTEKDSEELRILSVTLDDQEWERLAEALEPARIGKDSLEVFSAESTLVPIAQERWAGLTSDLPSKLVDLVLPAKEFHSYDLSLRRKALHAAIGGVEHISQEPEVAEPLPAEEGDKREYVQRESEANYYLLPVSRKNEKGESGREVVTAWLRESYWGLNKGTMYRQHFKKGDKVCFYASGEGIVAIAVVADKARARKPRGLSRQSEYYLPLNEVRSVCPSSVDSGKARESRYHATQRWLGSKALGMARSGGDEAYKGRL
ncbi:hypothetical protein IIA79_05500 [bacterium]|nr:hypothetical protein [bacterium]